MNDEVFGNEVSLLSAGVTPSAYFRFPGLVSNQKTMSFVSESGLITLGSQAWLAKGERPSFGSIILIHGNRNEPVGEDKLLSYLGKMDSQGHSFGHIDEALKR
jgi:hypothetical protein